MPKLFTMCFSFPLLLLAWAVAGSDLVQADSWPQYNGPSHNRISLDRVVSTSVPRLIWKIPTNTGFSSFVVGGGKAYTMVRRAVEGQDREVCIAVDADSGKEIWAVPTVPAKYNGDGNAGTDGNQGGDGPRTTPSFYEGKVYFLDARLGLYCLDAGTGRRIWRRDILQEYEAHLPSWQNATAPLLDDGLVFVAGGGPGQSLLAFGATAGELVWAAHDERMTHATPVAVTIAGIRQIIFVTHSGLMAVAPKTGALLWRQPYPFRASSAASPVVYQDIVYYSAGYGVGAGAYRVVKQSDGQFATKVIWRKPKKLINHWSTPVCKDGYLYGMFSFKNYGEGPLKCVDIQSGDVQWSVDGFGPGNCIVVGEHVIALSDKGEVVLIEATPTEYRELSRDDVLDGKCWSTPAFAENRLYVRSTQQGAGLDFSSDCNRQ